MEKTILYIVIPCYNEEEVLPITSGEFLAKINELADLGKISNESRVLFVNDGSRDRTWEIITELAQKDEHFIGISQSRNRGHQNAVLAGLMEAKDKADITISIDCDGQDDINAMNNMVDAYLDGCEIVYGVRSKRDTDSFFKRFTAQGFYKLLNAMGAEVVYNHADYRLVSSRVLQEFSDFKEVNLYLRGMFPLVGFKSTSVYYERHERIAGESHYPLGKMLGLAFDGITSLSIKPIRSISVIIFSAAEITRRSLATGCCCKSSFRHRFSIVRSWLSISVSIAIVFCASSASCFTSAVTAISIAFSIRLPISISSSFNCTSSRSNRFLIKI